MEQLLQPTEGAEKSADKTAQQNPQQNQKTGYIIRKAEFRRTDHSLKRPDGACTRGTRAGIAVQSRHADRLALPLIDSAL